MCNKVLDEKLQELINDSMWKMQHEPFTIGDIDTRDSLVELQALRKTIKQQGSILDNREELITKLIEDGDRLALILSDGAMPADEICCVDYFHAKDAVYKHAELINKL